MTKMDKTPEKFREELDSLGYLIDDIKYYLNSVEKLYAKVVDYIDENPPNGGRIE